MKRIERALISVTDKSGIVDFARALGDLGVEILSTGGTARTIGQSGVDVLEVADFTGFPEMLDGRVKTLNPKIHAGILFRRGLAEHEQQMARHGLLPIDLVCVNLYPFEATVANPDVALDEAIENIDIGGPTLLRAAAKNFEAVTVVVDPLDYARVLAEIRANDGGTTSATRFELAKKVFAVTSHYDAVISQYLGERKSNRRLV
jgi:phosphoribosylaminoimidazolecarboxamide formyltransferase/IMP cyclohydrolase